MATPRDLMNRPAPPGAHARAREQARTRAEAIKQALTVADLADLREADLCPETQGWSCDCPTCHGAGTVKISAAGKGWLCSAEGCGACGDVVAFEMAASGKSFAAACESLEGLIAKAPRDAATGDLFKAGAS